MKGVLKCILFYILYSLEKQLYNPEVLAQMRKKLDICRSEMKGTSWWASF